MNKLVPRNIVQGYLTEQGGLDIVAFLCQLRDNGIDSFLRFCCSERVEIEPAEKVGTVLFHGAPGLLSVIEPRRSVGENGEKEIEKLVYATDDPNYAIFLSILRLRDARASVNSQQNEPELLVDLDFVNGPSSLENGFVHIVSEKGFRRKTKGEFASSVSREVLFVIEVTPADLTVPIRIQTG